MGGMGLAVGGCRSVPVAGADRSELHLALLSDTHIPADPADVYRGFRPWSNLERVVPQVIEAKPLAALINGDAARLEGKEGDYVQLKGLLDPLAARMPVYIGFGNHDDRSNFAKVFPEPAGIHPKVDGRFVSLIDHPVVRLIQLDSLQYPNKTAGLLGRAQRTWLGGYLAEVRDRPVVLVVHHTLGDGDGDLLDAERLFDLVRPHRHVKAIVYGHSHVWAIGRRDRLQLINLPAVGYNFRDADPVGWVEARFREGGVALTLRAIGGNRQEDGKVTKVPWA